MASSIDNGATVPHISSAEPDGRSLRGRGPRGARGTRGDRGSRGLRGTRGITVSSQSRTHDRPAINSSGEQGSKTAAILPPPPAAQSVPSTETIEEDAGETTGEADVCFICASDVIHQCLAPCNHRTCHICGLRMRALYKNKDCAHCRVSNKQRI